MRETLTGFLLFRRAPPKENDAFVRGKRFRANKKVLTTPLPYRLPNKKTVENHGLKPKTRCTNFLHPARFKNGKAPFLVDKGADLPRRRCNSGIVPGASPANVASMLASRRKAGLHRQEAAATGRNVRRGHYIAVCVNHMRMIIDKANTLKHTLSNLSNILSN